MSLWRDSQRWAVVVLAFMIIFAGYFWLRGDAGDGGAERGNFPIAGADRQLPGAAKEPALPISPAPLAPASQLASPAPAAEPAPPAPASQSKAEPAPQPSQVVPASQPAPSGFTRPVTTTELPRLGQAQAASDIARNLRWPVQGRVLARMGWIHSETMGDWRWHPGVDIAAPPGTPVLAAAAGRVTSVRQSRHWGWEITIEHPGDSKTYYAGCGAVRVQAGETVREGQIIGEVGESPLAEVMDPPHIHFELFFGGRQVDPLSHLR